jgi:hypothetical protein
MSYSNNNNSTKLNNNKSGYKTFCKVCQDSGKTEKEYTNHNVRDIKGKTVCPVLLAQECRNCYKHGHTFKYCPLIKSETKAAAKKPYEEQQVKTVQSKPKNVFMLLESDSESEEEKDFPVLQEQQQSKQEKQPLNYSRLINLTEEQVKKEEVKVLPKATVFIPKATVFIPKATYQSQKGKLDWATAESDSEGDEEEEEEEYYPVNQQQVKQDLSGW